MYDVFFWYAVVVLFRNPFLYILGAPVALIVPGHEMK